MTTNNLSNYSTKYLTEKQYLEGLQAQLSFLEHEKNAGHPSLDSKLESLKKKILEKTALIDPSCSERNRAKAIQINTEVEGLLNVVATEIKQLQEYNLRVAIEKAKQDISNLGYILSLENSLERKTLELESLRLTQPSNQMQTKALEAKVDALKAQNLKYRKEYRVLEEKLKQNQNALSENKKRQKMIFVCTFFSAIALFGLVKISRK